MAKTQRYSMEFGKKEKVLNYAMPNLSVIKAQ